MDSKSEQWHQKKISSFLEERGYFVVKLISTNKNGIPDLLAVHSTRPNIWCEVKKIGGKASPLQITRIIQLGRANQIAVISYGFDNFLEQYKSLIK